MKIIQTLWLKDIGNPIENKAGWYSPEYHWMAWALSCLKLREFYDDVELITNEKGKGILIDLLQLPYTKVTIIQFSELTNEFWSLAKVETYGQQSQPFLHVDGDVFIWQAFDNTIVESELIAQNSEDWFWGYDYILKKIDEFKIILPSFIKNFNNLESYNFGVVGGRNIDIFRIYKNEIFEFVKANQLFLQDLVQNYNHSYVNMFIEQFMFTQLADTFQIQISTILPEKITDPDYPEITNLYNVPRSKKFVHLMGKSKSLPEICKTLSKILRRYYPEYYYRIIKNFLMVNLPTSNISYQFINLDTLCDFESDIKFNKSHFTLEVKSFSTDNPNLLNDFQQYELEKKKFHFRLNNIDLYYKKDVEVFTKLEDLFNLEDDKFITQSLQFDDTTCLVETLWDWNHDNLEDNLISESGLFQTLLIPDIYSMKIREESLDSLNMILLDTFLNPTKISEAIQTCALYYDESEIVSANFIFLIRERIRDLMNLGALKWV